MTGGVWERTEIFQQTEQGWLPKVLDPGTSQGVQELWVDELDSRAPENVQNVDIVKQRGSTKFSAYKNS